MFYVRTNTELQCNSVAYSPARDPIVEVTTVDVVVVVVVAVIVVVLVVVVVVGVKDVTFTPVGTES